MSETTAIFRRSPALEALAARKPKKILLVYPEFFPTYWGMQYYLPLQGQKSLMPPLGLITIAALTPPGYAFRLVDLNCEPLTDEDIAWADLILFSAMLPQKSALFREADRCRRAGKPVAMGGPYPTACPFECQPHSDVLVLNEGEITWPLFLKDLEAGCLKPLYQSIEKPDVTKTPCPRFDLLKIEDYAIMPIQFSRGCPFMCEFCDIIVMYGRRPRTKTPAQMLRELDAVYATGYRGRVFIVDDNFIGNKQEAKGLLRAIKTWNREHGHCFNYGTEASVNLADDDELLRLMVEAGLMWVFLGLETPSIESLKETRKVQNTSRSLLEQVQVIQRHGLAVHGGFIIGFDSDTEDIFDRQIEFITQAAIANAMIGPLVALPGTPLFNRLRKEGRLLEDDDDHDRTPASGYTNIDTRIASQALLRGHRRILETIYAPDAYFGRTLDQFLRLASGKSRLQRFKEFVVVAKLILREQKGSGRSKRTPLRKIFSQFPEDYRRASWRFLRKVLLNCPEFLPRALGYILMGYHYYMFTFEHVIPDLDRRLANARAVPRRLPAPVPVLEQETVVVR